MMDTESGTLDSYIRTLSMPSKAQQKLGVAFTENEGIRSAMNLLKTVLHTSFVHINSMSNFRALCPSEYVLEQRMNLRFLYKSCHEGFKKLHGFNNATSNSILSRYIAPIALNCDSKIADQYESSMREFSILLDLDLINDEQIVSPLIHYRGGKEEYIYSALEKLGRLDLKKTMICSWMFIESLNKLKSSYRYCWLNYKKRKSKPARGGLMNFLHL